jgi:hypothetical protein
MQADRAAFCNADDGVIAQCDAKCRKTGYLSEKWAFFAGMSFANPVRGKRDE